MSTLAWMSVTCAGGDGGDGGGGGGEIGDLVHQRHAADVAAVGNRLRALGRVHHQGNLVVFQRIHDVRAAFIDLVHRAAGHALR